MLQVRKINDMNVNKTVYTAFVLTRDWRALAQPTSNKTGRTRSISINNALHQVVDGFSIVGHVEHIAHTRQRRRQT